jgi:O-acetylhomoserine (thiol)-lyase
MTLSLHGGFRFDTVTNATAVPLYQTIAYQFPDADTTADIFALRRQGNIYTRVHNPTSDVLQDRIAMMEGGIGAQVVASGQAASTYSILALCSVGDNFISSTDIYGGSWNLFNHTLRQLGIEVRFVDPTNPEDIRSKVDSRTRAYYAETLPNPKLHVFPIKEVAAICNELGIPFIIDNTAAPTICKPFDHGAHIIVYSSTKYLCGHGTSVGGLIVDSGRFDWEKCAERFPLITEPEASFGGVVWSKQFGKFAYLTRIKTCLLQDMGAAISPFNSFLTLQGVETVVLRMKQHSKNALKAAKFLQAHPKVERVIYPGIETGQNRRRADAVLKGGYGGLVGFELKGGVDAGKRFINNLKLFYHVANIGDARSLAIHPASTINSQLSPEEQLAQGSTPGYVRLSIGIEDPEDIIDALREALELV